MTRDATTRLTANIIAQHTAKELASKAAAALTNKGGGKSGKADRLGGAAGHAKFKCPVCAPVSYTHLTLPTKRIV